MSAGTFAQRFADFCGWPITVESWDGTFDAYGNPNRSAGVSLNCRIEERVRIVKDSHGVERASGTTLYVIGGPLTAHDRITMPASFKGPNQPPIINVSNVNDKTEFSHTEVYL